MSLLKELEKGLNQEKQKLKVDEDDILNDATSYYKQLDFNLKKRLQIQYRCQPAVDTGRVTRQFFTKLLEVVCDKFFSGSVYKSPIYSPDIAPSGIMRHLGTVFCAQYFTWWTGFPVFSPCVYSYLATGDVDVAMATANYGDCSEPIQHFITTVTGINLATGHY